MDGGSLRTKFPGPTGQKIVIALCVVALLVLIWVLVRRPTWGNLDYWRATLHEGPDDIYARSAGGADLEARTALDRTQARLDNPRIQGGDRLADRRLLSRILRLSFLDVPGFGAHTLIVTNGQDMVAELQREIPGMQRARAHQFAAAGRDDDAAAVPDPVFYITELLAAEALAHAGGFQQLWPAPSANLNARNAEERRRAAAEVAATPGQAANLYLDMAQVHNADRENSHDPSVSAAIRTVAARLRGDPHTSEAASSVTLEEIIADFRTNMSEYTRDPRTGRDRPLLFTKNVLPVIERARAGESIAAGGDGQRMTDRELLCLVWARSSHPRNRENKHKLRDALFWGLVDCWNNGMAGPHIVCVQGRMARMAGSLAMLDFDQANWMVMRLEDIRNDIMEGAKRALAASGAAVLADSSEPPGTRRAAAEMSGIECPDDLPAPSPDDESRAKELLTAAMIAAADQRIADINMRVPGAVRPAYAEQVREELRWVIV